MKRYIAALDQGTTSSRCILFDQDQNILGTAQRELTQIYPQPAGGAGPMEIWSTQYSVLTEVLAQTGISPHELAAIGITNQREDHHPRGKRPPAAPSITPSSGSAAARLRWWMNCRSSPAWQIHPGEYRPDA